MSDSKDDYYSSSGRSSKNYGSSDFSGYGDSDYSFGMGDNGESVLSEPSYSTSSSSKSNTHNDDSSYSQYQDNMPKSNSSSYSQYSSSSPGYNSYESKNSRSSGYNSYSSSSGYNNNSYSSSSSYSEFGSRLPKQDFSDKSTLSEFVKDFYTPVEEVKNMSASDVKAWQSEHDVEVHATNTSSEIPNPILKWEHACLPEEVLEVIASKPSFKAPTPIQSQGWPVALSGFDMIGLAETGSGKTLAFTLPAIVHIREQPPVKAGQGPACLVITPTRELAIQISKEITTFGESSGLTNVCIYGGVSKGPQISKLSDGVDIAIATPGRLIDLLESDYTNLRRVTYLVLDEADRLMEMGFDRDIRKICSQIRPDRQTLMWSATWPKTVRALARDFLNEPIKITVQGAGSDSLQVNRDITQKWFATDSFDEKCKILVGLIGDALKVESARILIFMGRKVDCDSMVHNLQSQGFSAHSLHGGKSQKDRDWVLAQFRKGFSQVLIATDVVSRGIDVKGITLVVNFDAASDIASHTHRIGRTGRAGSKGEAATFLSRDDRSNARYILDMVKTVENSGQQLTELMINLKEKAKHDISMGRGGNSRNQYRRGGYRNNNRRGGYGRSNQRSSGYSKPGGYGRSSNYGRSGYSSRYSKY